MAKGSNCISLHTYIFKYLRENINELMRNKASGFCCFGCLGFACALVDCRHGGHVTGLHPCLQIMVRQLTISQVQAKSKDWRANVLVLEKCHETSPKSGFRIQKLTLIDKQGDKVLATIWNGAIDLLQNSLVPYKKYAIGGASVELINPKYLHLSPGMTHEWTISKSTFIRPLTDDDEDIPISAIPPLTCNDMIAKIGTAERVDLIAVVVEVRPIIQRAVDGALRDLQECVIVQRELRPIVLTLWGGFITCQGSQLMGMKDRLPIIVAKRLMPKCFSGLSLSTTIASFMAVEPAIPQVKEFRAWVSSCAEEIKQRARKPKYDTFHHALQYKTSDRIYLLDDLVPDNKNQWVEVYVEIGSDGQKLTYTACPQCRSAITADPDEEFPCNNCDSKQKAQLKCRLDMHLTDRSRTILATAFDKLAEEILGSEAKDVHKMSAEAINHLFQTVKQEMDGKKYHACIRTLKRL